jgi:linoleate 10R-lipoxygenase
MRLHEIMGIEANRKWGVCSLNEFRKVCGSPLSSLRIVPNLICSSLALNVSAQWLLLQPVYKSNPDFLSAYASFLEWNSDKEIAEAAERLYTNIENLELYVGLQAEEAKKPVEGAGLCPGSSQHPALLTWLIISV